MKIGQVNENQVQDSEARESDIARAAKDSTQAQQMRVVVGVEVKVTKLRHRRVENQFFPVRSTILVRCDFVNEGRCIHGTFESSCDNANIFCIKMYLLRDLFCAT